MSNLISRLLVGVIGLPLVLGLVWLGGWWLTVLVLVAGVVAVHEFVTVARPLRPLAPALYLGVALALVLAETSGVVWMLGGVLSTFVLAFAASALAKTRAPSTVAIGATVLGAGWIGFGLGHLLLLRDVHHHGRLLAFTILLTVWAADTFAYFGGKLLGRHKLAPTLSPGKTWEGFVIGSIAGVFVSFVALYDTRHTYLRVWEAILLGLVVVLAAVVGDLFESMLKRDMQVKDTGRLLGGHGGIIDRVDALLFAGPAAYYLLLGFH
jgi:phosphatidate cytidylyltransferase